jgi:ribosome biogenesis GTPase / thiamine phosphate phosphatase
MLPFLHDCRYPGCSHDHEPGCAVRVAVQAGTIATERYESYLRLLKGEE